MAATLETMSRVLDFEMFRPTLETALAYGDGAKGRRPPYDFVAKTNALQVKNAKPGRHGEAAQARTALLDRLRAMQESSATAPSQTAPRKVIA